MKKRYYSLITIICLLCFAGCENQMNASPEVSEAIITSDVDQTISLVSLETTTISTIPAITETVPTIAPIVDIKSEGEKMIDDKGNEYSVFYDRYDWQKKTPCIILSVTPQKIYWDKTDFSNLMGYDANNFSFCAGKPMNICIPAELYNSFYDADGIILRALTYFFDASIRNSELEVEDTDIQHEYITGIIGINSCNVDRIIPIKDGRIRLCREEELPQVDKGFFTPSFFIPASRNMDQKFEDGISVGEADIVIEQFIEAQNEFEQWLKDNPNIAVEIASYALANQSGFCMRAVINKIY